MLKHDENIIYQAGDTIEITKEMFDTVSPDEEFFGKNFLRQTIRYMFGNNPTFPIEGVLEKKRIDHESGQLVIKWQNTKDHLKETNTHFLSSHFNFEHPEFEKIPIIEADDELLNVNDLIIKYLMIDNDWSEKQSEEYVRPVLNAMKKAEAVFYQP